jgi:glucosamine--fructose-6-phosphate aminotransferase (isomerizing)
LAVCGIVGYVGKRPCEEILFKGLQRLEYRGYDSAGISVHTGADIECTRAVGNLSSLGSALAARAPRGGVATAVMEPTTGIGHTRWATHGAVTCENAHPHTDTDGRVHIVLNGIVENHLDLRSKLTAMGAEFSSETDAEVVAHLISHHYNGDLGAAVLRSLEDLSGHYAFVAMCVDEPDLLVGTRRECPLVIGFGEGEHFVGSAITAFLGEAPLVHVLAEGEVVALTPDGAVSLSRSGETTPIAPVDAPLEDATAEKGEFDTFMLKEIHEQGVAVAQTLSRWLVPTEPLTEIGMSEGQLLAVKRITIVGCGTSYHAGLAGRLAFERWARVPVSVEVASEFRYGDPLLEAGSLVIGITQSGETADTLAAMRLARQRGATVLALTNAVGSQATRDADGVLFTRAGLEVGVAATKTFAAQASVLYAFALHMARIRETLTAVEQDELRQALALLPGRLDTLVRTVDPAISRLAERLAESPFFLYLGRQTGLPAALEGALKLKEISYIATDAYAAGEMKHGPIALLGPGTPVVCVATDVDVLDKMLSNISEVRARGARVFAIATEGAKQIAEHAEDVVYIPDTNSLVQVILAVVPLQLLAYHIARARGLNVDQPRNLAKTVTVE